MTIKLPTTEYRILPPTNRLWNTRDAAYYLACHEETIKKKARNGEIPVAGKMGLGYRFRKHSLDTWLYRKQVEAQNED